MLQADVFAVLFMNKLKNLTNVVIGKLSKLVHKQNCSTTFFNLYIITSLFYKLINTVLLKQKKFPVLDIPGFFFTHTENEACYIQYASIVSIVLYLILKT